MRRLMPSPLFTLFLVGFWLTLAGELSVAQAAVGLILGIVLPLLTARFLPQTPRVRSWGALLRLAALFVCDVIVANLVVARLALGPRGRLRPAFVEVRLDMDEVGAVALLAALVTLTPGTVSVDIDRGRRVLLVHALVVDDPDQTAREIKSRYESRIKEIFAC